jgi:hypothetical protein
MTVVDIDPDELHRLASTEKSDDEFKRDLVSISNTRVKLRTVISISSSPPDPDLSTTHKTVSHERIDSVLGIDLDGEEMLTEQRTFERKKVTSSLRSRHVEIGVPAGWHSQSSACSIAARVRLPRENRSPIANHNIPTAVGKPRR